MILCACTKPYIYNKQHWVQETFLRSEEIVLTINLKSALTFNRFEEEDHAERYKYHFRLIIFSQLLKIDGMLKCLFLSKDSYRAIFIGPTGCGFRLDRKKIHHALLLDYHCLLNDPMESDIAQ